jgi:hypothetical protein
MASDWTSILFYFIPEGEKGPRLAHRFLASSKDDYGHLAIVTRAETPRDRQNLGLRGQLAMSLYQNGFLFLLYHQKLL